VTLGADAPLRVLRSVLDLPPAARGAVVAIGNFDGIHRGHQAVIGEAVRHARHDRQPAGVLTFEPHPRRFFKPDGPPFLLTRLRTKARLLNDLDVDLLYLLRFNAQLAARTAENFIDEILVKGLGVSRVVVGYDFVFGKGRTGNPELLRDRLAAAGVPVSIMSPVGAADAESESTPEALVYSSTGVRDSLKAGDPRAAARLLGRPFEIEGRIVHGDKRGRTLGFPTANLKLGEYVRPAFGIYAVRAAIATGNDWVWRDGVANLGIRPMFGAPEPLLETFLFDFSGEIYGRVMRVALVEYLRPEQKFADLTALTAQMHADTAAAKVALAAPARPARVRPTL
jgi:riboflavin kinase/FMN adenylyltransferase